MKRKKISITNNDDDDNNHINNNNNNTTTNNNNNRTNIYVRNAQIRHDQRFLIKDYFQVVCLCL